MPTARQRRFVSEYLRDLNATRAAIRAGFAPNSARSYGSKLARHPQVGAAIGRALAAAERRVRIDADRIVTELMRIAFSDIRAYVAARADGGIRMKPLEALTPDETAAIESIAPGNTLRGPVLRLHGKRLALRALARHVGLHERRHAADPRLLIAETERIRDKVLRAAGLDPAKVLPPPEEE